MFIKCNSDDGVAWINIDHVKRIEEVKTAKIEYVDIICIVSIITSFFQIS